MSKIFYSYDHKKLEYYPLPNSLAGKIKRLFVINAICLAGGLLFFSMTDDIVQDTIVEKLNEQKVENILKFDNVISDLEKKNATIKEFQKKDDKLYRSILNVNPLDPTIRNAGFGGSNFTPDIDLIDNQGILKDVSKKVDIVKSKLNIQKQSYEMLYQVALLKNKEIDCTPSIQPISIDNFKRISDYYGYRRDPFSGFRRMHNGIDIAGPKGSIVYSTAEGVVTKAEYVSGYGNLIEIDHGFNLKTRYGHLDTMMVKEGEKVRRGKSIGKLGNTGRSTAPHLHYEVRKNGIPTNPLYFFCNNISSTEYNRMIKVLNEKSVERF